MKKLKNIFGNIVSRLIIVNVSYGILDILLSSFLISYIMHSFTDQITGVAVFYICWTIMISLGFLLAAERTKRGNKMAVFRASIILRIIACIVLGLTPLTMPVAVTIGCLLGLADGAMNMPWHNVMGELLSQSQLIQYNGYKQSVSHTCRVILPILIGTFISMSSYSMMVWLVIPFSILSYIVSFTIKSGPSSNEKFMPISYVRKCVACKFNRRLLLSEFLRGLSIDRLQNIITILIVLMLHTDFALGAVKSASSVVIILFGMIMGRFLTMRHFPRILTLNTTLMILSTLLFITVPTITTLVIYTLVYSVAERAQFQLLETNMINGSNYNELNRTHRVEYIITREYALNFGRLLNQVALLAIGITGGGLRPLLILTLSMVLLGVPMTYMAIKNSTDIMNNCK